jgi:hypothetical protein
VASAFGGQVSMHSPSEALWSARERKCDLVLLEIGLGSTLEHWRKADTSQSGARFSVTT